MQRLSDNKIILIKRSTRLEELVARFNTINQAKFYIEHLGADFSDYEIEHQQYLESVRQIEMQLRKLGLVQVLDRVFLPNFIFSSDDTIVVVGQDGLVANTLKYLNKQPVVAVNPDPDRWDGVLLPFTVKDVATIVTEVLLHGRKHREITMAKAKLSNRLKLYAVNDLFIGPKSHVSARYHIKAGEKSEQQSSSGIIVSTGLGSTGWLKSILAGAKGIGSAFGASIPTNRLKNFAWGSDYLYFTVREPFPSKSSDATLVFGKITEKTPLTLISQMPENGVIFSDGIENDFLEFNSGTRATITVAEKKGHLIV